MENNMDNIDPSNITDDDLKDLEPKIDLKDTDVEELAYPGIIKTPEEFQRTFKEVPAYSTTQGAVAAFKQGTLNAYAKYSPYIPLLRLSEGPLYLSNIDPKSTDKETLFDQITPEYKNKLEEDNPGFKISEKANNLQADILSHTYNTNEWLNNIRTNTPQGNISSISQGIAALGGSLLDPQTLVGGAGAKIGLKLLNAPVSRILKSSLLDNILGSSATKFKNVLTSNFVKKLAQGTASGASFGASIAPIDVTTNKLYASLQDKSFTVSDALSNAWEDVYSGALIGALGGTIAGTISHFTDKDINRYNNLVEDDIKFNPNELKTITQNFIPWTESSHRVAAMEGIWNTLNDKPTATHHIFKYGKNEAANNYLNALSKNNIDVNDVNNKFQEISNGIYTQVPILKNLTPFKQVNRLPDIFQNFVLKNSSLFNVNPKEIFSSETNSKYKTDKFYSDLKENIKESLPENIHEFDSAYTSVMDDYLSKPENDNDLNSEVNVYKKLKDGELPEDKMPENVQKNSNIDLKIAQLLAKRESYKSENLTDKIESVDNKIEELKQKIFPLRDGSIEAQDLHKQLIDKSTPISEYKNYLDLDKEGKNPEDLKEIEQKFSTKKTRSIERSKEYKRLSLLSKDNDLAKAALNHYHLNTFEGNRIFFDKIRKNALTSTGRDLLKIRYALEHGKGESESVNQNDMNQYANILQANYPETLPEDYEFDYGQFDDIPDNEKPVLDQEQIKKSLDLAKTLDDKDALEEIEKTRKDLKNMPIYKKMFRELIGCIRNING